MKAKAKAQSKTSPRRRVFTFPQVNGKVIESVEASADEGECNITININDQTKLSFDICPEEPQFHVIADYASWKTGNFRAIKRWGRLDL